MRPIVQFHRASVRTRGVRSMSGFALSFPYKTSQRTLVTPGRTVPRMRSVVAKVPSQKCLKTGVEEKMDTTSFSLIILQSDLVITRTFIALRLSALFYIGA